MGSPNCTMDSPDVHPNVGIQRLHDATAKYAFPGNGGSNTGAASCHPEHGSEHPWLRIKNQFKVSASGCLRAKRQGRCLDTELSDEFPPLPRYCVLPFFRRPLGIRQLQSDLRRVHSAHRPRGFHNGRTAPGLCHCCWTSARSGQHPIRAGT